MGQQFKEPTLWEDLPAGVRVFVSSEPKYGLCDLSWNGNSLLVGGVVASHKHKDLGCALILLDRFEVGAFSLDNSSAATKFVDRKFCAGITDVDRRFFWVGRPKAVRLYDPTFLSELTAFGNYTCKCGAMNKDVAASTIINGKYLCYMCRVIVPRETAT